MWANRQASAGCSCSERAAPWPESLPARHACFASTPLQAAHPPWHSARRHCTGRLAVACVQAAERPAAEAPAPNQALSHAPAAARGPATSLAGPPTWMTGLELPRYDRSLGAVELVVAGAGPSGLAVADRVSQAGARSSASFRLGEPRVRLLLAGLQATCLLPVCGRGALGLAGANCVLGPFVARSVHCRLCPAKGFADSRCWW